MQIWCGDEGSNLFVCIFLIFLPGVSLQLWCGDGGRRKLNRRHQITYGRLPVCQCKAQIQNFKLQKYKITNCKNTKLQILELQSEML